ncbi:precorrin-6A reductase [Thermovenabulum sp.]|uniref:precorrin-6A reductase n=1 Tax=Thermovenabulum sp. TaxID=3100335 RepID=UPI003C79FBFD
MIWIIGGTSDVKKLLLMIHKKADYAVTVATDEGKRELEGYHCLVKKMNCEEMRVFIRDFSVKAVVDMSHPFAVEVTCNARKAAQEEGIEYIRYLRRGEEVKGYRVFETFEDCARYLKEKEGNVFFTIGSKNIELFERIKGNSRYVYRILPAEFSISRCKELNIPMENIVAMKGPFSVQLNAALFKEYEAKYVVMKESGEEGGFREKIKACEILGIEPLVIKRPEESGIQSVEEILNRIKKLGLIK